MSVNTEINKASFLPSGHSKSGGDLRVNVYYQHDG